MPVSEIVIQAYADCYTAEELRDALKIALNDRASGVVMTQVNFQDGGGAGQVIQGDPNEVIEMLQLALERKQNPGAPAGARPLTSSINFSTRRSET